MSYLDCLLTLNIFKSKNNSSNNTKNNNNNNNNNNININNNNNGYLIKLWYECSQKRRSARECNICFIAHDYFMNKNKNKIKNNEYATDGKTSSRAR